MEQEVPRERLSLQVPQHSPKLGSRGSPGGDVWWEMARQEALGKESVWWLSRCWSLASPNGFSLHASPFPASSAGSQHHVCTHSSSGTLSQVLPAHTQLGKQLQLHSWSLCFAAATQGGRIRAER